MARARNIKPGFYKNEDLAECSVWARFIFPGLWMLADREGRLEDRPKRIKGELLPFDSHDAEPLLHELEARGFILRYVANGTAYIQIVAFSKHQNPHHREPESVIPSPESPRLLPDATNGKPEALQPYQEPEAQGKPEASPSLHTPRSDLPRGVNPADSLIPDSGFLIPDSGVKSISEPSVPPDLAIGQQSAQVHLIETPDRLPCPVDAILALYHELLPDNPRCKVINAARKKSISSRWREASKLQAFPFSGGYTERTDGLAKWREFFAICAESPFLTGRTKPVDGRPPFIADIDFLFSPSGFVKTLENKYHREVA